DGTWYDIDCRYSDVPRALIPEQMRQAIEARYPEARVRELKRERRGWEATLRNGLELTFNSRMQLVDIDD
ncbi:MAG: PepSY-like domain-containing protein, partial [Alistipes sp.]|nr:PepSY-like domain-containing protein [Alistipes sp.]